MPQKLNIGLIGCGNVAGGLDQILHQHQQTIAERTGYQFQIIKAFVRDKNKIRANLITNNIEFTTNLDNFLAAENLDIIVELSGDPELALDVIKKTIAKNLYFITANKALLAKYANQFWSLCQAHPTRIGFEASVGGSIPIIRVLQDSYSSESIKLITAILNGTSNYILTSMEEDQLDFEIALKNAQQLGYAEANSSLDLNGTDAAHKLLISATLAFHRLFTLDDLHIEGIENVELADILYATQFGYSIKLLGNTKIIDDSYSLAVYPTMIKKSSLLSAVKGVHNAFLINSAFSGNSLFYGRGAGAMPTAVSLASDLISITRSISNDVLNNHHLYNFTKPKLIFFEQLSFEHYIRINVLDKIGVLTRVSKLFSANGVSIHQVIQKESKYSSAVDIVLITHMASNASITKILDELNVQDYIINKARHIRIDNLI